MNFTEELISSEEIYNGRVVKLRKDKVLLPDGSTSYREVISHGGAVAAVPIDDNGNVILVKQFRYSIGKEVLEIPAGKIDPGETPEESMIRELKEEIQKNSKELKLLHSGYSAIGYSSEMIYIYQADELEDWVLPMDKDEFIEIVTMPFEKAYEMAVNNQFCDAKTTIGILLADHLY